MFKTAIFTPTAMSVAMAVAGIIPGTHVVLRNPLTAVVRHKRDHRNTERSVRIVL